MNNLLVIKKPMPAMLTLATLLLLVVRPATARENRVVQGLRYDEIAEITHSKCGTVKSRLCRGRATLRDYVQLHREGVWSA